MIVSEDIRLTEVNVRDTPRGIERVARDHLLGYSKD